MLSRSKTHADRATAAAYFESWQKKLLEKAELLQARIDAIQINRDEITKAGLGHLLDALVPDEAVAAASKYENPLFAVALRRAMLQVSERAGAMNLKMPPQPVIGTWTYRTLDARAIAAPGTSYPVIALSEGVISIGILLAGILPHCLHGEGDDFDVDWRSKLDANPALRGWFAEMIAKTLFFERPDLTRKYELKQESRRLFHGIAHHFVLFVVGHEYAHCILDHHLIDPRTDKRSPVERPEGWTELPPTIPALWGDEFIADKMGYELTRQAAMREGLSRYLGLCGPDLFFMTMRILEQGIAALRGNLFDGPTANAGTKTHPPIQLRYRFVQRVAREIMGKGEADDAFCFSKALSGLVGELQNFAHLSLLTLKGKGKTLDPIWLDD